MKALTTLAIATTLIVAFTQNAEARICKDTFGNFVKCSSNYTTNDAYGNLVKKNAKYTTRNNFGNYVQSNKQKYNQDAFGNSYRTGNSSNNLQVQF